MDTTRSPLHRLETVAAAIVPVIVAVFASGCAAQRTPPNVAPSLDLERYAGTWFEIAHLPFRQQNGCTNTTATYRLLEGGDVEVINRCIDEEDGDVRKATAKGWVPDPGAPAKLVVQFFWPFSGDYWVIARDDDYGWALVGTPSRKYLWILSRTPTLDLTTYDQVRGIAQREGYAVERLIVTPQEPTS